MSDHESTRNAIPGVPEPTGADRLHAAAKAALSMVPGFGGAAVELFQVLVQPPLERRRTAWMQDVGAALQTLADRGIRVEELDRNEAFTDAVLRASHAALRTHSETKREALRNAVLNVALGQTPDETVQHLLLSFVDDLSEMHLRILQVFHAPAAPAGLSMGGLGVVLERAIPELQGRQNVYDQLWRDIYLRGLVNTEHLHVTLSTQGLATPRTTELGALLLAFISAPG